MSSTRKRPPRKEAPPGIRVERYPSGHPQVLGYARVSTRQQTLAPQLKTLSEAGCSRVYCEHVSGAAARRPALEALIDTLRKGDTLIVVALDRLGRRMSELVFTLDQLRELGVHFRDLRSGVDTRSPHGRVLLSFLAAVAEAEREMCRQRILDGLATGKRSGRPSVITKARLSMAIKLRHEQHTHQAIGEALQVSEATVRRMLRMQSTENPRQLRLTE